MINFNKIKNDLCKPKSKKLILEQLRNEIEIAKKNGFSYSEILKILEDGGLKISISSIKNLFKVNNNCAVKNNNTLQKEKSDPSYIEGDFEYSLAGGMNKIILDMTDKQSIRFNYKNEFTLAELSQQEAVQLATQGKIIFKIKKEYKLLSFNDLLVGHAIFRKP